MTLLQQGLPGGTEIAIILLIATILFAPAVWVYRDASRRGNGYAAVWAIDAVLGGVVRMGLGGYVVALLYFVARDESDGAIDGAEHSP